MRRWSSRRILQSNRYAYGTLALWTDTDRAWQTRVVLPLSTAIVKALEIDPVRWMSWTARIDHPDVVAITTEAQRAKLHVVAYVCRELWDACAITSFVHEEKMHKICKIIARMQRRQLTRIRETFEDEVSTSCLFWVKDCSPCSPACLTVDVQWDIHSPEAPSSSRECHERGRRCAMRGVDAGHRLGSRAERVHNGQTW